MIQRDQEDAHTKKTKLKRHRRQRTILKAELTRHEEDSWGNHSGPPRSEEDGTSPLNACTRIDSNVRKINFSRACESLLGNPPVNHHQTFTHLFVCPMYLPSLRLSSGLAL
ncbi:hypothetical protein IAS59_005407 [Cryptococcus gattii]